MRRTLAVRRIAWTVLLLLCWSGCHAQSAVQEVPFETALASMPPEELGDLLMNQHRYVEATYVYSGGPMNAVLWNKAGIAWHHLLAIGKARSNYQRALQLDPNYADALNNLGATYFAERKYKTAIHYYQRALALAPRSAVYLVNLGTAYFAEGKTARGAEAYRKAFALDVEVFDLKNQQIVQGGTADRERASIDFCIAELRAGSDHPEAALPWLRKAINEGFRDQRRLTESKAFAALRETPEFADLLAEAHPR